MYLPSSQRLLVLGPGWRTRTRHVSAESGGRIVLCGAEVRGCLYRAMAGICMLTPVLSDRLMTMVGVGFDSFLAGASIELFFVED